MIVSPAVLIIAFKRKDNVLSLIRELARAGTATIYIAIDGPKNSHDLALQSELVSKIRALDLNEFIQIKIWWREENLGPAVSVLTAIEWLFKSEECGIILEDDLEISTDSIRFFSCALSTFAHQKAIGIISGSNFWGELGAQNALPFATYPLTWGWATWKDRWDLLREPFFVRDPIDLKELTLIEKAFWRTGIENCMDRRLDAWDIPFAVNFKTLGLHAVIPYSNFVTNIGFDEHAGNTFKNEWPLNTPIAANFSTQDTLAISITNDISQRIIHDIYRMNFRSVQIRPLRWVQHRLRFRSLDSLQKAIKSVIFP
jgi:hypothetical protein